MVEIKRIIRRVRGGSEGRLIESEDGRCYIAKFAAHPHGNRTLVNECVAQSIIKLLGISTPPLCLLRLSDSLLDDSLHFDIGNKRVPVEGDRHLGLLGPVDPQTKAIFAILPERFLKNITDLDDFARIAIADQSLHKTDQRKAVFVRKHAPNASPVRMPAYFIDHDRAFDGSFWKLRETSEHGCYIDRTTYALIVMANIRSETVSQIDSISEREILASIITLSESWLSAGDSEVLNRIFIKLTNNRSRLRRVVTSHLIPTSRPRGRCTCNNRLAAIWKGMDLANAMQE